MIFELKFNFVGINCIQFRVCFFESDVSLLKQWLFKKLKTMKNKDIQNQVWCLNYNSFSDGKTTLSWIFLLKIYRIMSIFLFELLMPLSVPNSKFWWIYLTRVNQYDKKNLILKADLEFVISWATLPMGSRRTASKTEMLVLSW